MVRVYTIVIRIRFPFVVYLLGNPSTVALVTSFISIIYICIKIDPILEKHFAQSDIISQRISSYIVYIYIAPNFDTLLLLSLY